MGSGVGDDIEGRAGADDELLFDDEPDERLDGEPGAGDGDAAAALTAEALAGAGWRVLVVDDEPEMHSVSRLALADLKVQGRSIELLSAYSSAEARALLAETEDIAVALLDVVMETDHAGLELARWIREDHGDRLVRLVLRTGQPGLAPEQRVMADYDINDYRAKTEMTVQRLVTTVVGAIRSYRDLCTIEAQKVGLERIIRATSSLFERQSIEGFISGLLLQIGALLRPRESAMFFQGRGEMFDRRGRSPVVIAATGRFERFVGRHIGQVVDDTVLQDIQYALMTQSSINRANYSVYGFSASDNECAALFLEGHGVLDEWDQRILQLFCSNAAVALDNQRLHFQQQRTMNSIARFVPGPILELLGRGGVTRVKTGDHVARDMTVLFADLEAFTGLAESLGPERTFTFLNEFYAGIAPIIQRHGGVVDKYLGDGVMVLFPGPATSAVAAAVDMLRWTKRFNDAGRWPRATRLGIGIDRGPVVLGMLGADDRLDWTVIADCVNAASRLERLTRELGVDLLVSADVHRAMSIELAAESRPLGRVRVRGRASAIAVHEVFAADAEAARARKRETAPPLAAICEALRGGATARAREQLAGLRAAHRGDPALRGLEGCWGLDAARPEAR